MLRFYSYTCNFPKLRLCSNKSVNNHCQHWHHQIHQVQVFELVALAVCGNINNSKPNQNKKTCLEKQVNEKIDVFFPFFKAAYIFFR